MLIIRRQQIEVFRQIQLREFEDATYTRLLRIKPIECTSLGEEKVRNSIRSGVEKAISYGIEREGDVAKYIEIMYMLGHEFETDPRYPWAKQLVDDTSIDGEAKVNQLAELAAMTLALDQNARTK